MKNIGTLPHVAKDEVWAGDVVPGTELSVEYALGMTNVLAAVFLYNAQDLEKHAW